MANGNQPRTTRAAGEAGAEAPLGVHRWNFWISASEAAVYITAAGLVGTSTLIPFLFKETGIDKSWLGLLTMSYLLMGVGGPIGSAWAGRRRWKLPFCLKVGFLQRLAFVAIPVGAMTCYDRPRVLLAVVVAAWCTSHFLSGLAMPLYQVMLASSVREAWWGRRLSAQNAFSAVGALVGSGFVWWANRRFGVPTNFVVLGWFSVVLLFVSFAIVTRIREVPLPIEQCREPVPVGRMLRKMARIMRDDERIRWLVAGRTVRTCGFLLGTYMTAVLIERCGLTHTQMWIPVVLFTLPQIFNNIVTGWFVDRYGVKPATVISALIVSANSVFIVHCHSLPAFAVLFFSTGFGGSLMMNSWSPLLMKLAPPADRPAYFSTVFLAAAPGSAAIMAAGMFLVRHTGFDYVFHVSAAGGAVAALIFLLKLPHLRRVPA